MAISDKLNYLIETKRQLKETINFAGGALTNETFRQYPEKLYDKYLDILKDNGEVLFNGLPKDLGSGTSISMNNTANTRMKMSLAPSELEQATTTGENLAQLTLSEEGTAGGITYKPNEDGSITITGTRTSGSTKKAFSVYLEPSTRYYFNCFDRNTGEKYENSQLQGVVSDFIVTINDNFRTTSSFVAGTYDLALKGSTNGASFNGTYFFSLAKEDLTTYEPYTGGIASPNPDYPQDIHTISGDNEIKVENKNLFDKDNANILNAYIDTNGKIISYSTNRTIYMGCKENTTYCVKKNVYTSGNIRVAYFTQQPAINSVGISFTTFSNINYGAFTTPSTAKYLAIFVYADADRNAGKTVDEILGGLQVEYGNAATSYVSHQEQALPLTLGTLEYCKIGDYEDEFVIPSGSNIIKELISGSRAWGDGVIGDNEYYSRTNYIEVKPSTAYYIQHGISSGKGYTIWCYDSNKTTIGSVNLSGSSFDASGTITTLANTKYIIANFYNETINTNPPMINEGSTALPYEPYNNGKWYLKKNIEKEIMTGSGTAIIDAFYDASNNRAIVNHITSKLVPHDENIACLNKFSFEESVYSSTGTTVGYCMRQNTQGIMIRFDVNGTINSRTLANEWLQEEYNNGTPLIMYYVLATPTYTLLNDTLQEELNNINKALSYDTQTNISQVNNDLPFVISASAIAKYDLNEPE